MSRTRTPALPTPRRRLRSLTAVAAVGTLLAATGCGMTDDSSGGGGGDSSAITIALPEEPRSLASWNAYSTDGYPVIRNVEEALVNRDPATNDLVGELATDWEQLPDDPNTWRFTLREGVTFHDGSPFNAEAAAYSLNHVLSEENGFPIRTFVGPEPTAAAVDEYTLDVTTEEPDPILPTRLYFVSIPSMKALQENPEDWEDHPVGTGPYEFVEWNRGRNIVLRPNEDWWGRDDPAAAHGGNEEISEVTFVFRPEAEVRASMVSTGEAQLARWLTEEQCESSPQCKAAPGIESVILRLDTPHPTLADPRVREAIALAFDKSQIIHDIIGGGEVAAQIVGPSALGFNESLEPYPHDPERARALIEEAAADGVDVDAELTVAAREGFILRADEIVQLIAQALTDIGLTNVSSEMRETAVFEEAWTAGYDNIPEDRGLVGLQQHGNELMDFSNSVEGYYACDGPTSAYCNEELDQMLAEANQLSGEERDTAFQELAEYIYERHPVVPIGQPNFYFGLDEGLEWEPRLDGFLLVKEMSLS